MQDLLIDTTAAVRIEPHRHSSAIVALRWPEEAARRDHLAAAGIPRLLFVRPGSAPPPIWAVDEDWLSMDASPQDRAHREATLRRRLELLADPTPPPVVGLAVDEEGLARRRDRWVALTDLEVRLVRPLLAADGRCVSRQVLLEAGWPGEGRRDRSVDGAIRRVRTKLRPLGVQIHGISGAGYLLEVGQAPVP